MVLDYFKQISAIPRGSRNNKAISDYLVEFAKRNGLRYIQDEALNVVIYKDASPGCGHVPPLVMQGHMDMVCEKVSDSIHDFLKDGIEVLEKDGYLYADGTTLGGDDGIAVAYMMEFLTDDTLVHPPLEMVITTDEEIGMCGAKAFDASVLKGRRMINIDSEEEGIFTVSCAGGAVGEISCNINRVKCDGTRIDVILKGLKGGHSGIDIAKNRHNAVITLGRLAAMLKDSGCSGYGLISFEGGKKDNVIPNEAVISFAAEENKLEDVLAEINAAADILKNEMLAAEPDICFIVDKGDRAGYEVFDEESFDRLVCLMTYVPNGVQVMSAGIAGMVESSCNLGIFAASGNEVKATISMRSSKSSYIDYMDRKLEGLAGIIGGSYRNYGAYPGWDMKPESEFRELMCRVYKDTFNEDAVVEGVHAGLEGGLFVEKIPDMDIVSIGPDMHDIHTVKERIEVASVGRVERFLRNVIESLCM